MIFLSQPTNNLNLISEVAYKLLGSPLTNSSKITPDFETSNWKVMKYFFAKTEFNNKTFKILSIWFSSPMQNAVTFVSEPNKISNNLHFRSEINNHPVSLPQFETDKNDSTLSVLNISINNNISHIAI